MAAHAPGELVPEVGGGQGGVGGGGRIVREKVLDCRGAVGSKMAPA